VTGSNISSHRDLKVWQEAMTLAVQAYNLTAGFPRHEAFGLTAQIRRAATSIAANIAEAYGRESTGSYIHFLRVSQGSLKELETLLILSGRVSLSTVTQVRPLLEKCDELGRMLRSLIRSVSARNDQ
jgi:four helix bundle protein